MNDEIITSYLLGKKAGGGTPPVYQDKEVSITQNGTTTITKDSGYDALSSVELTVAVPQPSGKITITQNGTDIDVSSYASADVNVPAGADLNDYFNSTITGAGNYSYPAWAKLIKKIPDNITLSGRDASYLFAQYFVMADSNATIINDMDLSNAIQINGLFQYNNTREMSLDLSNWTFGSNIEYAQSVFNNCWFTNIDFSSLGTITKSRILMDSMFGNCTKLKKVNLSNFNMSGTGSIYASSMFANCTAMEEIDLSSLNFSRISDKYNMFGSSSSNGIPDNCLIYVKDQDQVDWFTTNFSRLTNVQIKS